MNDESWAVFYTITLDTGITNVILSRTVRQHVSC